jgi:hypothetical protein
MRRRSDEKLGDGGTLDNLHGSAAERTVPERARRIRGRQCRRRGHVPRATKQLEAERQEGGALSVSEKSEVADAHKAARQQVQEESSQELIDGQSHQLLLVAVRESRQRKVTWPLARATNLLLAMATR